MVNLKTTLAISIPVAIVIIIISLSGGYDTLGTIALGYAIIAGIFWKFAKHL